MDNERNLRPIKGRKSDTDDTARWRSTLNKKNYLSITQELKWQSRLIESYLAVAKVSGNADISEMNTRMREKHGPYGTPWYRTVFSWSEGDTVSVWSSCNRLHYSLLRPHLNHIKQLLT